MAVKRVKFTFPENLIKEPLIYNLGREFRSSRTCAWPMSMRRRAGSCSNSKATPAEIERSLSLGAGQGRPRRPRRGDVIEG